jgi:hypothetical protein
MVTDSWRINPPGRVAVFKGKLFRPDETVPHDLPVYQVFTVINRYPRKELESRSYQVKIILYPADARIRVKTRDYRVRISIHIRLLPKDNT